MTAMATETILLCSSGCTRVVVPARDFGRRQRFCPLVVVNRGGKRGTFVLRLATGVACPPADGQCEVGITG